MTHDMALLLARLLMGGPFVYWGIMKLRGGEAKLVPGLKALGLPDATFLAYMVGVCELVGGIGVVLGWPIATFSVLLGIWCLITGYDAHRGNLMELLKNVSIAGGFFALAVAGSGSWALFGGAPSGVFAAIP